MAWMPFCFALLRMINSNRCGFKQLELSGLSGSPSVSSSSGECGNGILQYCYGFNMLQHWLLAQGLLQSVIYFQVSVICSSLLWYSTCIKPFNLNLLPIFQLIIPVQYIIITLYRIIKKWREMSYNKNL